MLRSFARTVLLSFNRFVLLNFNRCMLLNFGGLTWCKLQSLDRTMCWASIDSDQVADPRPTPAATTSCWGNTMPSFNPAATTDFSSIWIASIQLQLPISAAYPAATTDFCSIPTSFNTAKLQSSCNYRIPIATGRVPAEHRRSILLEHLVGASCWWWRMWEL